MGTDYICKSNSVFDARRDFFLRSMDYVINIQTAKADLVVDGIVWIYLYIFIYI